MNSPADNWKGLPVELRVQLERRLLQANSAGITPAPITAVAPARIPLSYAQSRFWFLDQFDVDRSVYNVSRAFRLQGEINPAALEKSLSAIIARHEALRTTVTMLAEEPTQKISRASGLHLSVVDLSGLDLPERERELDRLVTEEARRTFSLSNDLMLRAILYRLSPRDHALMIATHHIATDAWSIEILLREMSLLYAAELAGRPANLPPLPIQYSQFAAAQRRSKNQRIWKEQLDFWMRQLDGLAALLKLPTDMPRPARESFRGRRLSRHLPLSLVSALHRLSRDCGTTLFMTLLGAFQVLLARYSNETDICVGSPVAGRSQLETEDLIGLFVNTIALRTNLAGDPTFRELLARVRETTLGAFAHQDLPFERLVEELRPERNLSHSPIYQILFTLQNTAPAILRLPGAIVSPIKFDPRTAKLDLTWETIEQPDGLDVRVEYNSDLFREETVVRMIDHYQTLLESIVADPGQLISQLPMLTEPERKQILVDWATPNGAPIEPESEMKLLCYHQQFEAMAARYPERVAVVAGETRLNYRELNEQANRLAHRLKRSGVGPETLVGVSLSHSPRLLATLLAIAKAGGAYLPLEPDLPAARLRFVQEDSQAKLVVTEGAHAALLEHFPAEQICWDRDEADIAAESSENPECDATPDNLCYVLYTSGSTGKPKGVQIRHLGLSNLLESAKHEPGLNANDVMMAATRVSFDVSTIDLFLPLIVGARLVMIDRETAVDGPAFHEQIRTQGATAMFATPAGWEILLSAGTLPDGVKVICGGDALRPELAEALLGQSSELWNLYGPTETTVASTFEKIESLEPIYIGKPIANTEAYVLDPHGQPVPVGVPGELYIGGAGLARGYWNRPELTAEKFVPHPFRDDPAARLYRTGDCVRWHANGKLEYFGRFDRQVKVRGFRIELGEIENTLAAHPDVEDCAVVSSADRLQLVAYFVSRSGSAIGTAALRASLARELPEYMVPNVFVQLEAMPLIPSGKVDRNALVNQLPSRIEQPREYVEPVLPLEKLVAEVWTEVLGREQVGLYDNFFELGGHSLSAMRVVARVNRRCQVQIAVRDVFEATTVQQLSERVYALMELSGAAVES